MVRGLVLLTLVLGGEALLAEPRFMNAVPVVSGLADAPVFTSAADFTSDGVPDLLVASAKEIRVVPGRGRGTFGAPVVTPVAGLHVSGTADFNGDGRLDVYLSKKGEALVAVLLANGDGTFGTPFVITAGEYDAVVAADFDGDGQIDVATITGGFDAILRVFRSNGANGFMPLAPIPFGYSRVEDAAAGDFDGDGQIDIAVAGDTSNWILWNDGATFTAAGWPDTEQMTMIAAADFNGDGAADVVTAESDDSEATALVSFGKKGARALGATRQTIPVRNVVDVHTADANGDGLSDLVLVSSWAMTFAVVTANADGTFDAPRLYLTGPRMGVTAAGDADGDGKVDLLAVNASDVTGGLFVNDDERDAILFIRGNGDGTMRAYPAFDVYLATNPTYSDALVRYEIMDVTGDGRFDIVVYDWRNERISVVASDGKGGFAPAVHTPTLEDLHTATFLPAGDLDGDGHDDVVLERIYYAGGPSSWAVLHGQSDGTFRHGQIIENVSRVQVTSIIGIADLTGDGKADLLEVDGKIHPGNGAGSFGTPIPSILDDVYSNEPRFADVNRDGRTDVLSRSGNRLTVFLSGGGGEFTIAPQTWTYDIRAITDLNADGYVDLVVGSSETFVQLGKGDGTFTDLWPYSDFPPAYGDGQSADFDGDHHADLALGSHILFGNGDGTFRSGTSFRTDADFGFQLLDMANGQLILRSDQDIIGMLTLDTSSEATARPALTLEPETNPAPYGAGIALTARVASDDGIRARGAVRFESAGETIALVALDDKATATTYWGFELGTTTVTATYVGDERLTSASTSIAQQAVKAPTTINVTSYRVTPDHSLRVSRTVKYGEMIYFSGYVSPTFGSGYEWPTGEITIRKGELVLATLSSETFGFAGIHTWSALPVGVHTITFEWAGDAHYLPSSTSMKITVTPGTSPTKGRAARH